MICYAMLCCAVPCYNFYAGPGDEVVHTVTDASSRNLLQGLRSSNLSTMSDVWNVNDGMPGCKGKVKPGSDDERVKIGSRRYEEEMLWKECEEFSKLYPDDLSDEECCRGSRLRLAIYHKCYDSDVAVDRMISLENARKAIESAPKNAKVTVAKTAPFALKNSCKTEAPQVKPCTNRPAFSNGFNIEN